MSDQLLRLDQLADALNLPRRVLADVPPARPARGRYVAIYSLSAARRHLSLTCDRRDFSLQQPSRAAACRQQESTQH